MALERSRTFADLLREYRRAAEMTQEHLAEHAHLSVRALRKLENGESQTPRRDTVALLADALGLEGEERAVFVTAGRHRDPHEHLPTVPPPAMAPQGPGSASALPLHTFLSAALRGHLRDTRDTDEQGDEARAWVTLHFAALARAAVEERSGRIVELRGDAAFAVFSSARAALIAAVDLQRRLAAVSVADPMHQIRCGIGLDTGEAVSVEVSVRTREGTLAARLCSLAGPEEVLANETVIRLVGAIPELTYSERGTAELKGFAELVRVVQVFADPIPLEAGLPALALEAAPGVSAHVADARPQTLPIGGFLGALPRDPLVTREAEVAQLRAALEAVAGGVGRLLMLVGEPGIGKTRLAQEVTLLARDRGFFVVAGRCYESQQAVAYYPFLEALSSAVGAAPAAVRADVLRRWPEVVRLLPEQVVGAELPSAGYSGGPDGQQRLFWQVTSFLQALAQVRPVALLLDDLQWADTASLDLLQHVARQARADRIVLVGTYRDVEVRQPHPLEAALRDLMREQLLERVPVRRLSVAGTRALIEATLGHEPIAEELSQALYSRTEGNPFFTHEVVRALVEQGDVFRRGGVWDLKAIEAFELPESVRSVIGQRIGRLSAVGQDLLAEASVLGQTFRFPELQGMAGRAEADVEAALDEARAAGLVREAGADSFGFSHALVQQALYATLSTRRRRRLHRAAAAAIEQLDEREHTRRVAELDYHYFAAEDWERTLDYAQRAGERSLALCAPRAARDHFTHALEAARQLGRPAQAAVYLGRGHASDTLGDFELARQDYEQALETARVEADQAMEWRVLLALGLLWAGRDYVRTRAYYRQAYELAQAMGDPLMLAESLNRVGNWYLNMDDPAEAVRCHEQALEIFRTHGSQRGAAESEDLLGTAHLLASEPARGAEALDRAIAAWRKQGERELLSSGLATRSICGLAYHAGLVHTISLDHDVDVPMGEEALRLAREIGWRAGEAYALFALGSCLGPRGQLGRAIGIMQQARQVAEAINQRQSMAAASWGLGCIYADALAFPAAQDALEGAWELAREVGSFHWMRTSAGALAEVCAALGNLERATAVIDEALPAGVPMRSFGQRRAWYGRAALALAAGQPDEALRLACELGVQLDSLDAPHGPQEPDMIQAHYLAGRALAALNRTDEAMRALQAARETARAVGWRSLEWQICTSLETLLRESGAEEAARRALVRARELIGLLARTLDAEPLREGFLRAALGRLPEHAQHQHSRTTCPGGTKA